MIAAVDGAAYGGGFNLALVAAFLLASPRARFCSVFGRIGLVPDVGGSYLLPRTVGLQRAKDLMFTARSFGPEEAKEMGIVYEIHPEDVLMERAMEFAGRFRHASRQAIGLTKNVLNQSLTLDEGAVGQLEACTPRAGVVSAQRRCALISAPTAERRSESIALSHVQKLI